MVQKCIQEKFKKETNFLENLNAQVKRKESLTFLGAKKAQQDHVADASSPFRGKKKIHWIVSAVCIVIVSGIVGVILHRRWRRQQAMLLLLQGKNHKDVSLNT